MDTFHEDLTKELLEKNGNLSYARARTWVELLWEDFETTYAKARGEYLGKEMTGRLVKQWIDSYGGRLHEFAARNQKYSHMLEDENDLSH
ncbi:YfhJ family protein [Bacillus salacetis]|nr:YfhJ family protein [Bacillus salacetis]